MYDLDPQRVTKYDRNNADLEAFWLFAIMVAGKSAQRAVDALGKVCGMNTNCEITPLNRLRLLIFAGILREKVEFSRIGQYDRIQNAFEWSARNLDSKKLRTLMVEELEACPGVGPKTARFFVLHSRPKVRVAVLDTHILKWMSDHGHDVPAATPPAGPRYRALEEAFLYHCDTAGQTPAKMDLFIWRAYNSRKQLRPREQEFEQTIQ